ncbi:hypothetical protein E2C01_000032 [Portunus trituberculatus]|uniref:Secreted protein n=1 Tax=Portunus trituberculatus TaxID=210409 RepID=A0A5B7CE20_PORTR|nr:hypothetical protein [Portunus trituberculatus]
MLSLLVLVPVPITFDALQQNVNQVNSTPHCGTSTTAVTLLLNKQLTEPERDSHLPASAMPSQCVTTVLVVARGYVNCIDLFQDTRDQAAYDRHFYC